MRVVDQRFGALIAADVTATSEFLSASASVILTLEHALSEAGATRLLPDWEERKRGDALLADLDALGAAPGYPVLAQVGGDAEQFGFLYVLEGSRLGAAVVLCATEAAGDPRMRARDAVPAPRRRPALLAFVPRATRDIARCKARAPDEAIAGARAAFSLFDADSPITPATREYEARDGAR